MVLIKTTYFSLRVNSAGCGVQSTNLWLYRSRTSLKISFLVMKI